MITDFVNVPLISNHENLPELIDVNQYVGVELEVEYRQGYSVTLSEEGASYWRDTNDGSIYEGRELVLKRPMRGDELRRAISSMYNRNRIGAYFTTGTHIHINMVEANTTFLTIKKLVMLMYLIEEYLYTCQVAGRNASSFCHPMQSYGARNLARLLRVRGDDVSAYEDVHDVAFSRIGAFKYIGLNLSPLNRYGTVEFRYFPTATSAEELINYINICIACKKAIKSYEELLEYTQDEQKWNTFLSEHFPLWADGWKEAVPFSKIKYKFQSVVTANDNEVFTDDLSFKLPRGATKLYIKTKAAPVQNEDVVAQEHVLAHVFEESLEEATQVALNTLNLAECNVGTYEGFTFFVVPTTAEVPEDWSAYSLMGSSSYLAVDTREGYPTLNQLSTIALMATVL